MDNRDREDGLKADAVGAARAQLLKRLFPDGVPTLWCPLLTHYDREGAIDGARMTAHLKHLAPQIKGFLIPGSTGDAWELTDGETRQVIDFALAEARQSKVRVLVGALRPTAEGARAIIRGTLARCASGSSNSRDEKDKANVEPALVAAGVCGFTVCPPRGKELSQAEIGRGLETILATGLPTALYQLPQVTQNEISAELAAELAARHANFILFKDTSGTDRVALSGKSLGRVFLVRGAEGDYARWLNRAGGSYHGFLLSTANCFARELSEIIRDIAGGRAEAAGRLSGRVSSTVKAVFDLVNGLPDGNPFANANKAIDHHFAHGKGAATVPSPRLHAGSHLPAEVLRRTGEILTTRGFLPTKGYLE